jgi:hypothetical protein
MIEVTERSTDTFNKFVAPFELNGSQINAACQSRLLIKTAFLKQTVAFKDKPVPPTDTSILMFREAKEGYCWILVSGS